jgi:hypothetical protein
MVENCVNTCITTTDLDLVFFKEQVVFTEQKLTLGSKISVKNIRLLRYYQLSTKIHYFTQNPPMMKQCRF